METVFAKQPRVSDSSLHKNIRDYFATRSVWLSVSGVLWTVASHVFHGIFVAQLS